MKRKIALLLAGCLAISPVSAGIVSTPAFAAETESRDTAAEEVQVKDEDSTLLDTETEYPMNAGETRILSAAVPADADSSCQLYWSSETPDVVSIESDGTLTALSAGQGRIILDISYDGQEPITYYYEIIVTEPEAAPEEEAEAEIAAEASGQTSIEEEFAAVPEEAVEISEEASGQAAVEEESAEVPEEAVEISEEASGQAAVEEESAEVPEEAVEIAEEASEQAADGETAVEAAVEAIEETEEQAPAEETIDITVEGETEEAELMTGVIEAGTVQASAKAKAAVSEDSDRKVTAGWVGQDQTWSYIKSDGTKATGLLTIGKRTFYLDESGTLLYGWIKAGSNYYYADSDGALQTGWLETGGSTYYLSPSTFARKTGIQKIDGKLYLFLDSGKLKKGYTWVTTAKGRVHVDEDNTLHTGWFLYNGRWYYLQSNGVAKTGPFKLGGRLYFFTGTGAMITGWHTHNGHKFYLCKDGYAVTGWKTFSGNRYLFTPFGIMKTGWVKTGAGKIYYFTSKGVQVTGFRSIDGKKYYLRKDGAVTKGWKKISGKWYYFDSSCKAKTGWLTLGSRKFYLGSDGVMVTGRKSIGGVTYYFDSEGVMVPSTNSYSNTEEFIRCIAPLVQKYAPRYNVRVVSPIIAQAILESASGESSLGKKYNNFFGLKCGTLWKGKSVNLLTGEEYSVGTYTTIAADFRVYDNMEEGVKGYFEFLFRNRTRYNNLLGETDPYEYLVKIKEDGYATSSKYVQNVYNVLKSYNLTRFD